MFVPNAKNALSSPLACTPRPLAPPGREHAGNTSRADNLVLVRQAQRGNPAAFEELVRRCHKALLRLALRLTGSERDAQDVCQETFLSAYQNLARFRLECQFHTWIYRIATNRCLDYWRRRKSPRENSSLTVSLDGEASAVLNRMADHRPAHNPESNLAARDPSSSARGVGGGIGQIEGNQFVRLGCGRERFRQRVRRCTRQRQQQSNPKEQPSQKPHGSPSDGKSG